MPALSEAAPAKINLHLHVVGRRPDGYHLLDSLVAFAAVGDVLTVQPADDLTLAVTGPFAAGLAAEPDNLVLRAARALAGGAGIRPTGRLVLEKNLPVASGIGGGSADAAAALRLLRRLWDVHPDMDAMAQALGADVPVCLRGRPAVMSGIGERLAPAPPLPHVGIVLINPGVAVSTPSVFRARTGAYSESAALPAAGWADAHALAESLRVARNDLEAPAISLAPAISQVLDTLRSHPKCMLARMSGSGATCFGLFSDPDIAHTAASGLQHPGWWVWGGALVG